MVGRGVFGLRAAGPVGESIAVRPDGPDRRSAVRFPIEQEVRYKVTRQHTIEVGSGTTLNISSSGMLFTTERTLEPHERIEVGVNWPARLAGTLPLKLVVTGAVVRSGDGWAAIDLQGYEFRTQGAHGMT